jgi:hypothetical protein
LVGAFFIAREISSESGISTLQHGQRIVCANDGSWICGKSDTREGYGGYNESEVQDFHVMDDVGDWFVGSECKREGIRNHFLNRVPDCPQWFIEIACAMHESQH